MKYSPYASLHLALLTDTAIWKQWCCGWTCNRCAWAPTDVISLPAASAGPEHHLQLVRRTMGHLLEQYFFGSVNVSLSPTEFPYFMVCICQVWIQSARSAELAKEGSGSFGWTTQRRRCWADTGAAHKVSNKGGCKGQRITIILSTLFSYFESWQIVPLPPVLFCLDTALSTL